MTQRENYLRETLEEMFPLIEKNFYTIPTNRKKCYNKVLAYLKVYFTEKEDVFIDFKDYWYEDYIHDLTEELFSKENSYKILLRCDIKNTSIYELIEEKNVNAQYRLMFILLTNVFSVL